MGKNQSPKKLDFETYEFCSDFSIFIINESLQETIPPKEYKVHRYILSQQSRYFKVLFESSRNFTEHKSNSVIIRLKDPHNVFQSILNYMYTGYISISHETLISILTIADRFDIEKLMKHAVEYFTDFLDSYQTYFDYLTICHDCEKAISCLLSNSLDFLITPEEVYNIFAESQESGFEDIIPDWLLAISFDKLWGHHPEIFSSSRLERILETIYVQFKDEDQKLSAVRRIVEEYTIDGYDDINVNETWNKMVFTFMPFASVMLDAEETFSTTQADDVNKEPSGSLYTFEEFEEIAERIRRKEKINQLFQLVDFSLLDPNTWEDIFNDRLIPDELIVRGLFEILKENNDIELNEKQEIAQKKPKWLEVVMTYGRDVSGSENVKVARSVSPPSTTIEHFDQLRFEISPYLSDITIYINDKSYDFHKIILSKESGYFLQLLSSPPDEQHIDRWTLPWSALHPEMPNGFVSMIHLFYDPSIELVTMSTEMLISILISSMQIRNSEITTKCLDSIRYGQDEDYFNFLLLGCGKLDSDLSKLEEHQKRIREFVVDNVSREFRNFCYYMTGCNGWIDNVKSKDVTKDFVIEILDKCLEKCDTEEGEVAEISKILLFESIFDEWFPNAASSRDKTGEDAPETEEFIKKRMEEFDEIRYLITRYIDLKRLHYTDMERLEGRWWMPKDLFHAWLVVLSREKRRKESIRT
ncbi:230_t:CDS:2 [Acaulospora colombiana]|uniref:230_t:CDS:1 n=1 Tax=Acaulospora colombiana TaxID=27376 RepID=A0ACA9KS29_9GLOM|nr:230_t:CDS:2 [Acaulospora colombiana]